MITAQDIHEKIFERAKFGGYDPAEVDEFLEEIADDITNTQKEIAILKSKMKVLVDKIEEYRSNENALNQAVISAQKLAVQIEEEARAKADKMLADADAEVDEKLGSIRSQAEFENRRLAEARAASAKFFDGIRAMCNAQLRNIDNISSAIMPKAEPQPVIAEEKAPSEAAPAKAESVFRGEVKAEGSVEDAVRSIEESVSRIKPEPSIQMDLSGDMDAPFKKDTDSTQPFTL